MTFQGGSDTAVSFQPNGNYQDDATCSWTIDCRTGQTHPLPPVVTVTSMDIESDYDFLRIYDGGTTNDAQLAELTGPRLPASPQFTATGLGMLLQFTSDESVTGGGFVFTYTCGAASPPPPPARPPPPPARPVPPPPPGVTLPTPLSIQGTATVQGNIAQQNDHVWYSFVASSQGQEFTFEVQLGTLTDSVMDVVDVDRATVLVENDDDDRNGGTSYASYVEWTAPAAGMYYIMVKAYSTETGTFTLSATAVSPGAGQAGDPCTGPVTMQGRGIISHTPNGNYQDSRTCDWVISCPAGQMANFAFTQLETEVDYDFVTLFSGQSGGTQIDQVSGDLVDMAAQSYTSSGNLMTVEFTSDDSIGAFGFEGRYSCGTGGGPAPPAQVTGSATDTFHLTQTDGTPIQAEIRHASDHEWFQFDALAGSTYQVETHLLTLTDSAIMLIAPDRSTVLLENDDGERVQSLASYIEWHCPQDGTYYALVHGYNNEAGTFTVTVTDTGLPGGAGDPCNGGETVQGNGVLSFQPAGGTLHNGLCSWTLQCAGGGSPQIEFTSFDTERGYDVVNVYDGNNAQAAQVGSLSGAYVDLATNKFSGSGMVLTLSFVSDDSVGGHGFAATTTCMRAGRECASVKTLDSGSLSACSAAALSDADCGTTIQCDHTDPPCSQGCDCARAADNCATSFQSDLDVFFIGDGSHSTAVTRPSGQCYGAGGVVVPCTRQDLTFTIRLCIDHIDNLFFQDSRMWLQYGGQWGAAGSGCGDLAGKALVSVDGGAEAEWDISSLAQCTSGSSCPPTTLNLNSVPGLAAFRVPECDGAITSVTKTAGRGDITVPVQASAGNGFRGEIEFNDNTFNGPDTYSVEVTVSCGGAPAGVAAGHTYRLACANTIGTGTCHQGRLETLNPYTHEWGSICGHSMCGIVL